MSLTLRSAEPRRLETDAPLDTRAVVVPRSRKTPKVRTGSISRPGRPSPLVTTIKWVVIVGQVIKGMTLTSFVTILRGSLSDVRQGQALAMANSRMVIRTNVA